MPVYLTSSLEPCWPSFSLGGPGPTGELGCTISEDILGDDNLSVSLLVLGDMLNCHIVLSSDCEIVITWYYRANQASSHFTLQPKTGCPLKLSRVEPGQYLDGRPPGITRLLLEEVLVRPAGGAHPVVTGTLYCKKHRLLDEMLNRGPDSLWSLKIQICPLASDHHGLLIIPIHWLASSFCLLSTNKLVCGWRSGAIWLPLHHPGGCCTLVVAEEIAPFYVKRFEYPEKRYMNVTNYYLLLLLI